MRKLLLHYMEQPLPVRVEESQGTADHVSETRVLNREKPIFTQMLVSAQNKARMIPRKLVSLVGRESAEGQGWMEDFSLYTAYKFHVR